MTSLMLLFGAATMAPTPVMPAPPVILSAPVKHDVQCFILYAIAVQRAVEAKDDKVKQAGGLGVMYFFTKLKLEAPTLDLVETIKQQAAAMEGSTQTKEVGASCDTEFQQHGAALTDLGNRLKQAGAAQPSS